ncbi:hypothetical protein CXU10_00850 [Akkermansia muciniphila]|nr:hypothetical protein CXU10_00850 [Akkermansia muciniphila]
MKRSFFIPHGKTFRPSIRNQNPETPAARGRHVGKATDFLWSPCFLKRIVLSRINAQARKPFREDRQKQNTRQERTCWVEKEDEFLRA